MIKFNKVVLWVFILVPILFGELVAANNVQTETKYRRRDMIYVMQEPCYNPGDKCTEAYTTTTINPFKITNMFGGRMIEITFNSTNSNFTPDESQYSPYSINTDAKLQTFPDDYSIRISDCDDASLIGLNLEIGGLTTDQNGVLFYYIPF